jgi:putative membrane protein
VSTPSEQRLHPSSVFFALLAAVRSWLIPGLVFVIASRGQTWQLWLMPLFIPVAIAAVVRYFNYRYAFTDDDLVVRSGLLFRNERHIRYARIQNVESTQNLLHRLFGVVEVNVETAGGTEPEAKLRVLSTAALEEMRRQVFAGKRRSAAGAAATTDAAASAASEAAAMPEVAAAVATAAERAVAPDEEPARVLLKLPPRELILQGLIDNQGFIVVAALAGIAWEVGQFRGGADVTRPWTMLQLDLPSLPASLAGGIPWLAGALSILGLLVAVRLLSVGWALAVLYDYTLERRGAELRTRCGLFTRIQSTLPLRRIQLLSVREAPIHRRAGRVSVAVETAGGTSENLSAGRRWLAPLIRRGDLVTLLRDVMPDADPTGVTWRPVDPRAATRILRRSLWIAVLVALASAFVVRLWAIPLGMALIGFTVLHARGTARAMAYAITDDAVFFRSGWLWRRWSVARSAKIQAVTLYESPFDRRWAMAGVGVDTAGAGSTGHRIRVPFLGLDEARALHERLARHAAATRFRW